MMLNEEFALIHGVASGNDDYGNASTAAPWGDGTNALAFDGLSASISTANGTPAAHIQTTVGALTLSHIDAQLRRLYIQGGKSPWILVNSQEAVSLVHLAEASGSIIRVQANAQGGTVLGVSVTGYVHPITGEVVPVYASRFLKSGVMIFGSRLLPDGSPAADVDVLPQVQLPELAPTDNVMGYTAQELAPTVSAPQVNGYACVKSRCIGGTLVTIQ
jgi:hypothetical protein